MLKMGTKPVACNKKRRTVPLLDVPILIPPAGNSGAGSEHQSEDESDKDDGTGIKKEKPKRNKQPPQNFNI